MLVKYAVDAAAVWLATRQVWSPLDYLLPSMTLREPKLRLLVGPVSGFSRRGCRVSNRIDKCSARQSLPGQQHRRCA